jgi:hypothetical protein
VGDVLPQKLFQPLVFPIPLVRRVLPGIPQLPVVTQPPFFPDIHYAAAAAIRQLTATVQKEESVLAETITITVETGRVSMEITAQAMAAALRDLLETEETVALQFPTELRGQ